MGTEEKIPYCPWEPTGTQRLFLGKDTREVFFGGAAGGGKSVALLMAALKYVQQPGYAALIIRKDLPRLELAGGLIARSHEWFAETNARWVASRRTWTFPINGYLPATLTFGYLSSPLDKFRYASSEFQYIAFDELTDFVEEDYLFLFSRLRRSRCSSAKLRMRSASNPGGVGRLWVKRRFIEGAVADNARGTIWMKDGRCYIPSRISDNPYLNGEEYRQTLAYLPPLERERLLNGDWDVQPDGLIEAKYLRYYVETKGQVELLGADGRILAVAPEGSCYRFVTIDPAGTSADRARELRGRGPSWTVIQVWDQPRRELAKFLLLREQVRERVAFDKLCGLIREVADLWQPARLWIEGEKLGQAVVDQLHRKLPIAVVPTRGQDKATRAGPLIVKLSRGEIFLPRDENSWRMELEAEWLAWTGDERQPSDQVDAAAYAAIVSVEQAGEAIRLLG
jgi:phage terminase large subunit-like protein